mmetsp:Transcript_11795/g.47432  ORF Transcript_11795/g.47432 Transcript_11795/m.47432 type:complete len:334 (-) Transcript_11795:383-1384(-)
MKIGWPGVARWMEPLERRRASAFDSVVTREGVGDVLEDPASAPGLVAGAFPLPPVLRQRERAPPPEPTLAQGPKLVSRADAAVVRASDPLRRDDGTRVAVPLHRVPSLTSRVHDDDPAVLEAHGDATAVPFALLGGGAPRRARRLGLRQTPPHHIPTAARAVQVQRPQRAVAARHRRAKRILRVDADAVRKPAEAKRAPSPLATIHVPHAHAPVQRRGHRDAALDADGEHRPRVRLVVWTELVHRDGGVGDVTGAVGPDELVHVEGPSKQVPAVARGDQVHGSPVRSRLRRRLGASCVLGAGCVLVVNRRPRERQPQPAPLRLRQVRRAPRER